MVIILEIGPDLHTGLVRLISSQVPVAEKPEGRDMLLNGIFNQNGWTRRPDNKHLDIYLIVGYLKHYFTGEVEDVETWGLITFIDNAMYEVAGTTIEKRLQDLRQRCIACWEKEQLKQPQVNFSRDASFKEQSPSSLSLPEQRPMSLSPSKRSPSEDGQTPQEYIFPDFCGTVTCLKQIALETIKSAEEPFHVSFKASYVVKRRIALRRLEDVPQLLHQMVDYLEKAPMLPEAIAERRHILKNQVYRLIEQIQAVRSWIDTSSEAGQSILEKFEEIKQTLIEIHVMKGEDDTHQETA